MPSTISDKERAFRAQLDATLRGGKLSKAGAQRLLQQAKQGGLSEAEAHVLRGWAAQHRDSFEAGARAARASLAQTRPRCCSRPSATTATAPTP